MTLCDPHLKQTNRLVDTPSHRKVIDGDLSDLALAADDDKASETDALRLFEHPIRPVYQCIIYIIKKVPNRAKSRLPSTPGDGHGLVRDKRDVDRAEATVDLVRFDVGQVGVGGVAGHSDHLGSSGLADLGGTLGVGQDLGGTDPTEVFRVEE